MKHFNYPLIALILVQFAFLPGCKVKRRPVSSPVAIDLPDDSLEKRGERKSTKVRKRSKKSKKTIKGDVAKLASAKAKEPSQGITGSRWTIIYEEPEIGAREYDLIFRGDGKLENFHPNERTRGNDRWEQRGRRVILYFNNNFAIYEGVMSEDNVMTGEAESKIGLEWKWKAYRKK